jgi:hypothetical protein
MIRKILGIMVLLIGIVCGIYGYLLFMNYTGNYKAWDPPYSRYEIRIMVSSVAGVIGIIVGLLLIFIGSPSKKKKRFTGVHKECIVQGFRQQVDSTNFQSPFAEIHYIQGEVAEVGFYKDEEGERNTYADPSKIKFLKKGALAFVKNKIDGKVMVCINIEEKEDFYAANFKDFLMNYDPSVPG